MPGRPSANANAPPATCPSRCIVCTSRVPAAPASRPPPARHAMRRSRPSMRTSSRSRIMPTQAGRAATFARRGPGRPCSHADVPVAGAGPALLRPLLSLPRAAIDAYARAAGLEWVDDESNADTGVKRNFIRRDIAPRLAAAFPGYPATLARAAAHQAEAAELHDDLARLDGADALESDVGLGLTLDRAALMMLCRSAPHRARNLLRWFLRQHGLRAVRGAPCRDARPTADAGPADARVQLAVGQRSASIAAASSMRARRRRAVRRVAGGSRTRSHCRTDRWNSRGAQARELPARRSRRTSSPCARARAASAFGPRPAGRHAC